VKPTIPVLILAGALCAPAMAQNQTAPAEKPDTPAAENRASAEPDHIKVQHILIAFKGTLRGNKAVTRSKEEAKELAYQLLERAQNGEDYDALVVEYTNDSAPGIYGMSNNGVTPAQGEYARGGMVGAFGNVGFVLEAGEIGIADFNPSTSPYGWHIIKRIE
jgi:parvulin-like peptidyl-prolyl isomerase